VAVDADFPVASDEKRGRVMKRLRLLLATLTVAAAASVWVGLTAAPAGAEYGPLAVYQVTFSFNCNNPSFCGSDGLGGFWGWAVFNSDGTGDAELTGCGHLQGGPGGGGGGAGHFSSDIDGWFIGGNGDFYVSHETVRFVGHGTPVTMVDPDPPYPSDTGIPAAPGHYSTTDILGFAPPPGVSFNVQVTKIPNR
jgi:hypothetical protein